MFFYVVKTTFSQNENGQLYHNFSSHNFLKYNQFLLNPTFSAIDNNNTSISFLARNRFSAFADSPTLYLASYSGRVNRKVHLGLSIFQKNIGIFKSIGLISNYAYTLQVTEKSKLTFGFNFVYSNGSIDKSKIITAEEDSYINTIQDKSIISFQPAINMSFGKFDIGLFLENSIDYDITNNKTITSFSEKTISSHIMFTQPFNNTSGLLDGGKVKFFTFLKKSGKNGFRHSGNFIVDLPKVGWLQTTYSSFFGMSFGVGVNISKKLSIGFVYEKDENNLANTTEIGLTYSIGKRKKSKEIYVNNQKKNKDNLLSSDYKEEQDSINGVQNNKVSKNKKEQIELDNRREENSQITKRVAEGFYVVTNFFINEKDAQLFVKSLEEKNFKSSYFKHPITGSYYVYLKKFKSEKPAKLAVSSKLNNTYEDLLTIIEISGNDKNIDDKKIIKINELKSHGYISPGYYVIANVFSIKENADRFIKNVKSITSKYFFYPENNYYYVYLARVATKEEATQLLKSNLKGAYLNEKWIIQVVE